jgi:DNA-binding beta-propeller fold protein YncE
MVAVARYAWRMPCIECPPHAQPVAQVEDLRGACSVAFVKSALGRALGLPDGAEGMVVLEGERGVVRLVSPKEPGAELAFVPPLRSPCAIAADDEALLVVERAPPRIRIVHGTQTSFIGDAVLREPIAVAAHGTLVAVADAALRQVLVFDLASTANGVVARAEGVSPAGVAFDAQGRVWWTDAATHRVHRWDPREAGPGEAFGERGAFPGQFTEPTGIACRDGCVYVCDHLNHRIAVLEQATGRMIGWWGMHAVIPRQGKGRIHYPDAIAFSPDGTQAMVCEGFEDRVQVLSPGGPAPIDDGLSVPRDAVSSHFGPDASALGPIMAMTEPETGSVMVFNLMGASPAPAHITTIGGSAALPGRYGALVSVCVLPGERVVIADRSNARIDVVFASPDRSKPVPFDPFLPRLVRSTDLVAVARSVGAARPNIRDLAWDGTELLVLDSANRCVWQLDRDALPLRYSGGEPRRIDLPEGVREPVQAAARQGELVIADRAGGAIWRRPGDATWVRIAELGVGAGATALKRPFGVAYCDDGTLVVTDESTDAVHVVRISADGSTMPVSSTVARGILDHEFWLPQGATALRDGVLVVDRGNHRFQAFGADGTWRFTGSLGKFYTRKRTQVRQNELPAVAPKPTEAPPTTGGDS